MSQICGESAHHILLHNACWLDFCLTCCDVILTTPIFSSQDEVAVFGTRCHSYSPPNARPQGMTKNT